VHGNAVEQTVSVAPTLGSILFSHIHASPGFTRVQVANLVSLQTVGGAEDGEQQQPVGKSGMLRERLTSIWSLYCRAEKTFRIGYHVQTLGRCRVFRVQWVEEVRD
jgi:hypothetical protein